MDRPPRLSPNEITATYQNGTLTIQASGRRSGVSNVRIVEEDAEATPPVFAVVGDPSPAIGMFPYQVDGRFRRSGNPGSISMATRTGSHLIQVEERPS
ncbi:MAG: hypothetical protein JOZ41_20185 [Chloroflexi bacterium]|nr:hypothetical protein [Chloroflexota bacterium]